MIMPINLQKNKILKHLRRLNIAHDLIDINAIMDSTLSYEENFRRIMELAKSLVHDVDMMRLKEAGLNKPCSDKILDRAVFRMTRWQYNHPEMTRPLQDFL